VPFDVLLSVLLFYPQSAVSRTRWWKVVKIHGIVVVFFERRSLSPLEHSGIKFHVYFF
jgi:hypothetical protein